MNNVFRQFRLSEDFDLGRLIVNSRKKWESIVRSGLVWRSGLSCCVLRFVALRGNTMRDLADIFWNLNLFLLVNLLETMKKQDWVSESVFWIACRLVKWLAALVMERSHISGRAGGGKEGWILQWRGCCSRQEAQWRKSVFYWWIQSGKDIVRKLSDNK